jgi:hypothetical protein
MRINCPQCGAGYNVPAEAEGHTMTCAECGEPFRVVPPIARAMPAKRPEPRSRPRSRGGRFWLIPVAILTPVFGCCLLPLALSVLNPPKPTATGTGDERPTQAVAPPEPATPAAPPNRELSAGTLAHVTCPDVEQLFAAVDYPAHDALQKYVAARDTTGVFEMIRKRRAFIVKDGTRVRVISVHFFTIEVRALDGDHAGKEMVIERDYLQPE